MKSTIQKSLIELIKLFTGKIESLEKEREEVELSGENFEAGLKLRLKLLKEQLMQTKVELEKENKK